MKILFDGVPLGKFHFSLNDMNGAVHPTKAIHLQTAIEQQGLNLSLVKEGTAMQINLSCLLSSLRELYRMIF